MKPTKIFPQVSKEAARAKFNRMQSGAGRFGQSTFECGFSTWWWGKNVNEESSDVEYAIFVSTTYHSESTLDKMYESNCKNW